MRTYTHPCGTTVELVLGDITTEEVDAIVNAANSGLQHGGGVAGAIVRKGGRIIQEESNRLAPVAAGRAVITTGGNLPATHVIHTVGPRWGEGDEDNKLASAVRSALAVADEHGLRSISLPAISTGIFGFPLERAVRVILGAIRSFLDDAPGTRQQAVRLCLFDEHTLHAFEEGWGELTG
ncbi:macro domain-containing protein [bacterium]|nr:macro domain-containing protein [bacterium]